MALNTRVSLLVHPQFRPDRKRRRGPTERDVWLGLKRIGYQVEVISLATDIKEFDRRLSEARPDVVFNLLEEFKGEAVFDFHLISYLESLGIPYTGCNPRGLILSRNKFAASQIAAGAGVAVPNSILSSTGKIPALAEMRFPLFLKLNREHASMGIGASNRVIDGRGLARAMRRLWRDYRSEILIQEFVSGREISVSVWGNARPQAFAPWELRLPHADAFATEKVKFNSRYRRNLGIRVRRYRGPLETELKRAACRIYRALDLSGYGRIDFRVSPEGRIFAIDVNANPNLARDEDFAQSARASGFEYGDLLREIVRLARAYRPVV